MGVALFFALLAFTSKAIFDAWHLAEARSRSDAVFELVQGVTPNRPVTAPGAVAWLDLELRRYGASRAVGQEWAYYGELSEEMEGDVPDPLVSLLQSLPRQVTTASQGITSLLSEPEALAAGLVNTSSSPAAEGGPAASLAFREQRFVRFQELPSEAPAWLVLTRRRALQNDVRSSTFVNQLAPTLYRAGEQLTSTPAPVVLGRPLRILRVYALAEDGTFLSLPLDPRGLATDIGAMRLAAQREGREFQRRPRQPNFGSFDFFFRFTPPVPTPQTYYSGFYLDLAGHGLVTTISLPIAETSSDLGAVLAVDLAVDLDWQDVARHVAPPQTALLLPASTANHPWKALWRAYADADQPEDHVMAQTLQALARRSTSTPRSGDTLSVHRATVEGRGAMVAFEIAQDRWLVVLFPEIPPQLPWLPLLLLTLVGLSLLFGFEANRRRAEQARRAAQDELEEKENLLETMRVPWVVVDPNSDVVVHGNAAALRLGLTPGSNVADRVATPRAREHYHRMQRSSAERRRAYGVPLRVLDDSGQPTQRYAIVRSVSVLAPIPTLKADQRHRLGIFFVLDPEADLTLYEEDLELQVRGDERRRLAGLLAHGVDSLARVLGHRSPKTHPSDALSPWLALHLERRLGVTAWLLDHWDRSPPLPPDTTVEVDHVLATLERLQDVFIQARQDAKLRARLHWSNGILSDLRGSEGSEDPRRPVFDIAHHWPSRFNFSVPIRGGVGFFLEEILVNAIRHGSPGSRPRLTLDVDPVRRRLDIEVINSTSQAPRQTIELQPYGGRSLLEHMARLFGWQDLESRLDEGSFRVSWSIPVSERLDPDAGE